MAKETASNVTAWTKVQSTVEIEDLGKLEQYRRVI